MHDIAALQGAEAFLFDVFGTVVDWQGSVSKQLEEYHEGLLERKPPTLSTDSLLAWSSNPHE